MILLNVATGKPLAASRELYCGHDPDAADAEVAVAARTGRMAVITTAASTALVLVKVISPL
jgi:hypothetical protein